VFAHSSRGVGLNHGVDTGRVQHGLGDVGFGMAAERPELTGADRRMTLRNPLL